MRFLIPPGRSVLEIGCGSGDLLRALDPSRGVGVDISGEMIRIAAERHPDCESHVGNGEDPAILDGISGTFDFIVLSDTIGYLEDCEAAFAALRRLCTMRTRLIIAYYSRLWEPVLSLGGRLGMKMPSPPQNWLSTDDTINLLTLSGFEFIPRGWRPLRPKRWPRLGSLVNRYLGPLPGILRSSLRSYVVVRPVMTGSPSAPQPSCTVLIPCR